MLNQDYTAKLLDLEEVIVTKVENISEELHVYLELPRVGHVCPACGAVTDTVHDYRMQVIKDVPLARNTFLHLRKRRYRCSCGKRFFEKNDFLARYQRVTIRLFSKIYFSFEKLLSAKEIGSRFNVSSTTAMRYFCLFNKKPTTLPETVSVDEFKGNSGGQKYNGLVVDPENKRILDVLPNRYESDMIQYFSKFPNKNEVKYFICDMNPHFRNVAKTCFPNAKVVADKFHVIRQAIWAMERVRKNEQSKLPDGHRKYFKKSKYLLAKPKEKLTEEEMDKISLMFEIAPKLATVHRLKNEFSLPVHKIVTEHTPQRDRLKIFYFLSNPIIDIEPRKMRNRSQWETVPHFALSSDFAPTIDVESNDSSQGKGLPGRTVLRM